MESFGANCYASLDSTQTGRVILEQNEDTEYALGSILNYVQLYQTVIS